MRQHITVEQLNELSEEQKVKLRAWWQPQLGDWCLIKHKVGIDEHKEDICYIIENGEYDWYEGNGCSLYMVDKYNALPLLSIGQCIELGYSCGIRGFLNAPIVEGESGLLTRTKRGINIELIDALWQAVKEVL